MAMQSDQPVVQPQGGNLPEVGRVVRHERQIVDQCHRRNHQIHGTDGDSLTQQGSTNPSELPGALLVVREHLNVTE